MNRNSRIVQLALSAVVWASTFGYAAAADTYQLDQAHTFINFKAKRGEYSYVIGRFNTFSGSATWDESSPSNRQLQLTIEAGSVDTGNERRDEHLRSPDFFNAKQFPILKLVSTSIQDKSVEGHEKAWEVTGDFSMHGVTKPITLVLKQVGAGEDRRGNYNVGLQADFVVKRSEFGMTNMMGQGGDEIQCMVEMLVRRQ